MLFKKNQPSPVLWKSDKTHSEWGRQAVSSARIYKNTSKFPMAGSKHTYEASFLTFLSFLEMDFKVLVWVPTGLN